jgi:hypothetical protein
VPLLSSKSSSGSAYLPKLAVNTITCGGKKGWNTEAVVRRLWPSPVTARV